MARSRTRHRTATIDTLDQLDVVSSPFRIQLLDAFREPSTVKAVARRLNVPVTRLYHHVNKLVRAGFLAVVDERAVGSLSERWYQVTADEFRPSEDFERRYGARGRTEAARLVLRAAEAGFDVAARHGLLDDLDDDTVVVSLSFGRQRRERRIEFVRKLKELLEEYDDHSDQEEGEAFWRVVAFVPRWDGGEND